MDPEKGGKGEKNKEKNERKILGVMDKTLINREK